MNTNPHDENDGARFSRQIRLTQIGADGQLRIHASRVVLIGCGALGTHAAEALVRAGVRRLRLIDRDLVEWSNLPRQVLFTEADARAALPKAIAAANRLREIDTRAEIDPVVADLNYRNAESIGTNADLILDGTDNYETRYLLNDLAVARNIPWVYAGCVGLEGRVLAIDPGRTPCLRCLFPDPPPPGSEGTCETVGVLGTAAAIVANLQATVALRMLIDGRSKTPANYLTLDLWNDRFHTKPVGKMRDADCRCCARREYEFLNGARAAGQVSLCGRDAVQVSPLSAGTTESPERISRAVTIDLAALQSRLTTLGRTQRTPYFLRARIDTFELTVFPDGRAIIRGTTDSAVARSLYARYVGA